MKLAEGRLRSQEGGGVACISAEAVSSAARDYMEQMSIRRVREFLDDWGFKVVERVDG